MRLVTSFSKYISAKQTIFMKNLFKVRNFHAEYRSPEQEWSCLPSKSKAVCTMFRDINLRIPHTYITMKGRWDFWLRANSFSASISLGDSPFITISGGSTPLYSSCKLSIYHHIATTFYWLYFASFGRILNINIHG